MRYLVVLFCTCVYGFCCLAQSETTLDSLERKNSFYVEIAGNGGLFSINYDRLFFSKNKHKLYGRIGYGFLFNIGFLEANYAFGKKHCIETGISYAHDLTYHWLMYYRFGYRYNGKNGLLVRVAPLLSYNIYRGEESPFSVWYGVSVGYSF